MTPAKTYDVAIIGGGVIGLSIARAITARADSRKLRLVVIDAGASLPAATNAAAGMLAPSFESSTESAVANALIRLALNSLAQWRNFAKEVEDEAAITIDYQSCGIIGAAFTQAEQAELEESANVMRARGHVIETLTRGDVLSLEPTLAREICAGIFAPADGQVDPRLLLRALRRIASGRGVEMRVDRVDDVKDCQSAGVEVVLASGAILQVGQVIMASGAARDASGKIELVPIKGEALALTCADQQLSHVVRGPGAYLCPKAGGRTVIGATEYHSNADMTVDRDAINALRARAERVAPALSQYVETESWAGVRPGTPDGAPIFGTAEGAENVIFALGHYRNGVLLAPASAELIASALFGDDPPEFGEFSPDRFSHGRHG